MTEEQIFIIQMLPLVIANDMRLQVCTLYEANGVWKHLDTRCPKCCAEYILSYPQVGT